MHDTLSNLAGSPLFEWAWLKALLASSRGDLNLMKASLHAPTVYISSQAQTGVLVAGILR